MTAPRAACHTREMPSRQPTVAGRGPCLDFALSSAARRAWRTVGAPALLQVPRGVRRNIAAIAQTFSPHPDACNCAHLLEFSMKALVFCAAIATLAAAPVFAQDLIARQGDDSVRLSDDACKSELVLSRIE